MIVLVSMRVCLGDTRKKASSEQATDSPQLYIQQYNGAITLSKCEMWVCVWATYKWFKWYGRYSYVDDCSELYESLHPKWISVQGNSEIRPASIQNGTILYFTGRLATLSRPEDQTWQSFQLGRNFSNFCLHAAPNGSTESLQGAALNFNPSVPFCANFYTLRNHNRRQRRRLESVSFDRLGHAHFLLDNALPISTSQSISSSLGICLIFHFRRKI